MLKDVMFSVGSYGIIIIYRDYVLKIIPSIRPPVQKVWGFWPQPDSKSEIRFYEIFTREFLLTDRTPHIVGIYNTIGIRDFTYYVPFDCRKIDEILAAPEQIADTDWVIQSICDKKSELRHKMLLPASNGLVLEKCDFQLGEYLRGIADEYKDKSDADMVDSLLGTLWKFAFQILFTLAVIQEKYPSFVHNDLYLRNILCVYQDVGENDYIAYYFAGRTFYFPARGYCCKIADFGISVMPPRIVSQVDKDMDLLPISPFTKKDAKRDVFTFLYSFYSQYDNSISQIFASRPAVATALRDRFFAHFINVDYIDRIQRANRNYLDWMYYFSQSNILRGFVREPHEYLRGDLYAGLDVLPEGGSVIAEYNKEAAAKDGGRSSKRRGRISKSKWRKYHAADTRKLTKRRRS